MVRVKSKQVNGKSNYMVLTSNHINQAFWLAEIQKSPKKQWETWQKQLFLALFSPFLCVIPHCQVTAKVRAENVQHTRDLVVTPSHIYVTLDMLANLSFTQRKLVNFFVKNLHFFLYWIFISNLLYFIIGVIVKMLFNMVGCHPRHASRHVEIGSGIVIFVVMADQEEIWMIVVLEIGVQLGIKGESERFVFTRMNLFLKEM